MLKGTSEYESTLIFALWYQLGPSLALFKAWLKQTCRNILVSGRERTICSLPALFALVLILLSPELSVFSFPFILT